MLGTVGNALQRAKLVGRFGPGSPSSLLTSSDEGSVSPDPVQDENTSAMLHNGQHRRQTSPDASDSIWNRSGSFTPPSKAEAEPTKTPGFPKMNPNTEKLLSEVFAAYCAADGGSYKDSVYGDVRDTEVNGRRMNLASWRRFCEECRLVEGDLTDKKLELLFYDIAYIGGAGASASLRFEDFARALGQVCLGSNVVLSVDFHENAIS